MGAERLQHSVYRPHGQISEMLIAVCVAIVSLFVPRTGMRFHRVALCTARGPQYT